MDPAAPPAPAFAAVDGARLMSTRSSCLVWLGGGWVLAQQRQQPAAPATAAAAAAPLAAGRAVTFTPGLQSNLPCPTGPDVPAWLR